MANQLLYSVKEVFTSYCGTMKYFIPSYQRGYKWEEKDIKRLLDDINEFKVIDDFDAFYCLQNISIIENKGELNVVDGQQRLTTLSILLSYLGEADMVKGKLKYSKRQTTQKFLNEYVYTACLQQHMSEDWDTFIEKTDNQEYDYQDIFYIFMAWKTIDGWFIDHREELEPMKNKILENVKLIVNRPANIDEHKLFENLNGKRVPLDGADLVRAMIITRSAKLKIAEGEDSIKYDVLLNEYRTGIGNRLDAVNQWWQNENRQKYFSYFMAGAEAVSDGMIEFNLDKYPINNLYLLYGAIYNGGKLSLDFFEKEVTDVAFFDRLINVQRLLRYWYDDRILYHLIPFVLIYCKKDDSERKICFREVFDNWYKFSRKGFIDYLKRCVMNNEKIKNLLSKVNSNEYEKMCFEEDWYSDKEKPIVMVSVLLDIIKLLKSSNTSDRLPPEYFKQKDEDKEHIFPQTPIADKVKDAGKQTSVLKQYVEIINMLIKERTDDTADGEKLEITPVIVNDSDIDWSNKEWKTMIKNEINSKVSKLIPINSLGNMCLLDSSINRSYGNDFFQEKRIDIMTKAQEGHYIRPHVYDAFNKVFLERASGDCGVGRMRVWDKSDIIARRRYIIGQIKKFFENGKE